MKACECTNEDSSGMIKDRDWSLENNTEANRGEKQRKPQSTRENRKACQMNLINVFGNYPFVRDVWEKTKKKNLRAEHRVSNLCSSEQSCALDLQSLSDHLNIENLEAATAAAAHPDELDSCSDLDVSNTPPGYSASATKATLQQPQPGQRHVSHQNKQKDFCDGLAYFWLIPLSCFYYSTQLDCEQSGAKFCFCIIS